MITYSNKLFVFLNSNSLADQPQIKVSEQATPSLEITRGTKSSKISIVTSPSPSNLAFRSWNFSKLSLDFFPNVRIVHGFEPQFGPST